MKNEFKAKFLSHLLNKKEEGGFTLIELLVVIIIIGILSAIALPSFLNQAAKARQSEAKTYTGSVNRAQQAHRLDNRQFGSSFGELGIGVPTQTEYYTYTIESTGAGGAQINSTSRDSSVKAYRGAVQLYQESTEVDATAAGILCEANVAATGAVAVVATGFDAAAAQTTVMACPNGSKALNDAT